LETLMKALVQSIGLSLAIVGASFPIHEITWARLGSSPIAQASGSLRIARQPLPPGKPPAGRIRGGGSRSPEIAIVCPQVSPDITALVPFMETPQPGQEKLEPGQKPLPPISDVWGYTTAEHPTFWFYMPYSAQQKVPVTFSLQEDNSSAQVYAEKVTLPNQAGFISVRLPANQPGIQMNQRYRWFLEMECKPPSGSAPATDAPYVEGVIMRKPLDGAIASQIAAASGSTKASLYANNGFWFDALNILAELRRKNPQNQALVDEWRSLITSMNLSKDAGGSRGADGIDLLKLANQPFAK
jgi:Domain of Unknown Function (DUF928)